VFRGGYRVFRGGYRELLRFFSADPDFMHWMYSPLQKQCLEVLIECCYRVFRGVIYRGLIQCLEAFIECLEVFIECLEVFI